MSDPRVHRFVSNDFTVRAASVDATAVVKEMQQLHNSLPLPTVAVGRAMVGALLMASQLKEGQQVGLYIRGNGGLAAVYAEAQFEGQVRGYTPVSNYQPADYKHGLSIKEAIGQGTLTVARHVPFQKAPYQGTVQLVSGEIGEDIAHYLHQSHQIRSLVSLGVYLDTYGKVQAAGGVIVEVMPGVEEEVVEKLQKNVDKKPFNVSQAILDGANPTELVGPYLTGIPFTELDHDFPISYFCPCTKERVVNALETLGLEELKDMVNKKEVAEVTCQICGRPYEVSVDEIKELCSKIYKQSLN
jgi:molecular chaperone Hsp33